jgi:glucosamine kinase
MTAVLAVDLGKTGCRAVLWPDGAAAPALFREGPGAPGLAARGGVEAACAAVVEVCRALLKPATGTGYSLCVGAAGALAARSAARELGHQLLAELPVENVAVCSDATACHAGALGGGPGVVLAAGTGSVAVGLSRSGRLVRVDGWGPVLGDAGSGGWIGSAGLRAALRDHDGRGPATGLRSAAVSMFGELEALAAVVSQSNNPARLAGGFVAEVVRLAGEGDPVASRIIADAAEALAETIIAAGRRLDEPLVTVAVAGGLSVIGAVLWSPVRHLLEDCEVALRWQDALGGPLEGARLLASTRGTAHESTIDRVARHAPTVPR